MKKKIVKEKADTVPKIYKIISEFTLHGVVMHANQAILLTDDQAEEFAGHVKPI